jgi:hypothetical protein
MQHSERIPPPILWIEWDASTWSIFVLRAKIFDERRQRLVWGFRSVLPFADDELPSFA